MFQVEVKLRLIQDWFPPEDGWIVHCHLDGMELGKGQQQDERKKAVAGKCVEKLRALGVQFQAHPRFPKADVVALNPPKSETHLVEVEGESRRQREQAVYSALGQLLFKMTEARELGNVSYGLAVPDDSHWRALLDRLPIEARARLQLHLYVVGPQNSEMLPPPRHPSGAE